MLQKGGCFEDLKNYSILLIIKYKFLKRELILFNFIIFLFFLFYGMAFCSDQEQLIGKRSALPTLSEKEVKETIDNREKIFDFFIEEEKNVNNLTETENTNLMRVALLVEYGENQNELFKNDKLYSSSCLFVGTGEKDKAIREKIANLFKNTDVEKTYKDLCSKRLEAINSKSNTSEKDNTEKKDIESKLADPKGAIESINKHMKSLNEEEIKKASTIILTNDLKNISLATHYLDGLSIKFADYKKMMHCSQYFITLEAETLGIINDFLKQQKILSDKSGGDTLESSTIQQHAHSETAFILDVLKYVHEDEMDGVVKIKRASLLIISTNPACSKCDQKLNRFINNSSSIKKIMDYFTASKKYNYDDVKKLDIIYCATGKTSDKERSQIKNCSIDLITRFKNEKN